MRTEVIKIQTHNFDIEKIKYAADVLREGGLVVFPTETVYGLGANALDGRAVKNIFKAKGRPSDNPLIVHVSKKESVESLVESISPEAQVLMETYWPGPLTVIMNKSGLVSPVVCAGLKTVAVRMPAHPIALALIDEAGVPVAAPSANISGKPSPTNGEHVISDLYGKVDVIIDSGPAKVGLESTVVDTTGIRPLILRPGSISKEDIEILLSGVDFDSSLTGERFNTFSPKSPGMKYTHYSPNADVVIVRGELPKIISKIRNLIEDYKKQELKVGVLATEQTKDSYDCQVISIGDREKPETIAANLFNSLREFDNMGVSLIIAESIDETGVGFAIMNRLIKASGYNIINA